MASDRHPKFGMQQLYLWTLYSVYWLQVVWQLLGTVGTIFYQVEVMHQIQPAQSWSLCSNLQLVSPLTWTQLLFYSLINQPFKSTQEGV